METCGDEAVAAYERLTADGRRLSSASSIRVSLVGAYVAIVRPTDTRTVQEGAREREAAGSRRHGLGHRFEPTREGRRPEQGSPDKGEHHRRIRAGRAHDEHRRADKDRPGPHRAFDAFGEGKRRCRRDQERRQRAVHATPGRSARREPRPGGQMRVRRDGCEQVLHGVTSATGA